MAEVETGKRGWDFSQEISQKYGLKKGAHGGPPFNNKGVGEALSVGRGAEFRNHRASVNRARGWGGQVLSLSIKLGKRKRKKPKSTDENLTENDEERAWE